jgi:hypothetical protein
MKRRALGFLKAWFLGTSALVAALAAAWVILGVLFIAIEDGGWWWGAVALIMSLVATGVYYDTAR